MSSEAPDPPLWDALLRELPYAEEQIDKTSLSVSGVLVRSSPGRVRIVLGGYSLTFDIADVLDAVPLSVSEEDRVPLTVCLILRSPARLIESEPWTEFDQALSDAVRPFAFDVRPHPLVASPNTDFREREQNFLRSMER